MQNGQRRNQRANVEWAVNAPTPQNPMRLDMLLPGWQHGPKMSATESKCSNSRAPAMNRDWIRTAPSPFPSPPLGADHVP